MNETIEDDYLNKYYNEIKTIIKDIIKNRKIKEINDFLDIIRATKTNNYLLNNMIERLIKTIMVEIKYNALSSFEIIKNECSFELNITSEEIVSKNKENTISIKLPRKYKIPNIKLIGKIDRIDKKGNNYLVVDYKSSATKFDLTSFYNGEISQLLTYLLALSLKGDFAIHNVLGVFYRELANSKKINDYRLRGIINSDLLMTDEFKDLAKDIMFGARVTKKGEIDKRDKYQTYTSLEFEKLQLLNIDNILSKIEKIYNLEFGIGSDIEELKYLYKLSNAENTILENEYGKFKNDELKNMILNKEI